MISKILILNYKILLVVKIQNNSWSGPKYLLVEQHDVGFPHLVGRQSEYADAAVVRLVPLQLVIIPNLENVSYKTWSGFMNSIFVVL